MGRFSGQRGAGRGPGKTFGRIRLAWTVSERVSGGLSGRSLNEIDVEQVDFFNGSDWSFDPRHAAASPLSANAAVMIGITAVERADDFPTVFQLDPHRIGSGMEIPDRSLEIEKPSEISIGLSPFHTRSISGDCSGKREGRSGAAKRRSHTFSAGAVWIWSRRRGFREPCGSAGPEKRAFQETTDRFREHRNARGRRRYIRK